jgi:hypothetical protein
MKICVLFSIYTEHIRKINDPRDIIQTMLVKVHQTMPNTILLSRPNGSVEVD